MGKVRKLPFSAAQHGSRAHAEDPERMLEVFRRELSALARGEVRVTDCHVRPTSWRKAAKGRASFVYTLEIAVGGEPSREIVVLGMTPATSELVDELEAGGARAHSWSAPFTRSAAYLPELEMALLFFPLDPAMPGLAEITASDGARLLESWLPEFRAGARIAGMECELAHYKPFDRAVLRISTALVGPGTAATRRTVYAKFFADEDFGAECSRNVHALWEAARGASWLHVPEPLGYDAERRMLVTSEAPGGHELSAWIERLEEGEPLPAGIGREELDLCALASARALGELQRSGIRPARRRSFRDELGRLERDRDLFLGNVRASRPELAERAAVLIDRLGAMAPRRERLVPAHGAFRHKQILGDHARLTVVDWDGLCLANPALDAAAFLGRLGREPLRRRGAAPELAWMAARFRSAFLADQPELASDLDLYQGLELTEQVLRSFRRPDLDQERADETRSLAEAAGAMLDRVEARRGWLPRVRVLKRWLAHTAAALDVTGFLARLAQSIDGNGPR